MLWRHDHPSDAYDYLHACMEEVAVLARVLSNLGPGELSALVN